MSYCGFSVVLRLSRCAGEVLVRKLCKSPSLRRITGMKKPQWLLAVFLAVACRSAPIEAPAPIANAPALSESPEPDSRDPRLAYAAVFGDSGGSSMSRTAALGLDLMSDSGTYESSGRLPDSVAQYLLQRGLVSEICVVRDSTYGVPNCIAQIAEVTFRVSRLLCVGRDTVRVYIGGASIQPVANHEVHYFVSGAATRLLTLTWRAGRWTVIAQRITMMS